MNEKTTQLDRLLIERVRYGKDEGQLKTSIRYCNDDASIEMVLSKDIGQKILTLCIDQLCVTTDEAAEGFKKSLWESVKGHVLQAGKALLP